jgi:glycosyltransferase 2 family protein
LVRQRAHSTPLHGARDDMKKILLSIIQIAVTVLLLFWVFHDADQRAKMAEALRTANYRWLPFAILSYLLVELAAALRWQTLLRVQRIHLGLSRVFALFLVGMFFNQFLPGGTGGDIIKSYLLLKETPGNKAGALLAVIFDRLIGLVALVCITGALVILRYDWLAQTPQTKRLLWVLLFLLGTSISGLLASFVISGFNLLHLLPQRFPGREKLIEISAAYHLYARHWIATSIAFIASLIAHLATFTTFLCVAYALRTGVHVVDFFAIMPIERTISSLPISFGGAGWRELILKTMLPSLCGVSEEKAKLVGTLSFLVILLCSAPGGLVYLFYKPTGEKRHVRMREMETEVATLEHEIADAE